MLSPAVLPAQTKAWTQPKTSWGDPDIQGVWPGTAMVGTPLERDKSLGTRAFLTEDEFAKRAERAKTQAAIDNEETVSDLTRCDPGRGGLGNTPTTCKNGISIGPPLYWDDRGKPSKQASLVMDPPDGEFLRSLRKRGRRRRNASRREGRGRVQQLRADATIRGKTRASGIAASRAVRLARSCRTLITRGIRSCRLPGTWCCATR